MTQPGDEVLRQASAFHPQTVIRRGDTVLRDITPWTPSVHALLHHLEQIGIEAPRVVGSGYDGAGHETVTYVDGSVDSHGIWTIEGAFELGRMLRRLHLAVARFDAAPDHIWFPWRPRALGSPTIVSHSDGGPWNIVRRNGMPVAFIDWTRAGPIDPMVELAEVCWLNAFLHDDVVASTENLPPIEERMQLLRTIVDGYALPVADREKLVDTMTQVAVLSAADDADQAGVDKTMLSAGAPPELVWALSWQVRGAAWQIAHRRDLLAALH